MWFTLKSEKILGILRIFKAKVLKFLSLLAKFKKSQWKIKLVTEPLFSHYLSFVCKMSVVISLQSDQSVSQLLRIGQSIEPLVISVAIVECLRQRCSKNLLWINFLNMWVIGDCQRAIQSTSRLFQKLKILPEGMTWALLLVEILGLVQKSYSLII